MKTIWLIGLALLLVHPAFATPPEKIVFFGDSLTDNGNIYYLDMHLLPKSPPYYTGRFSNGPTWAENVGQYYADHYKTTYDIYAWGGATAVLHNPFVQKSLPITLTLELDRYLLDSLFQSKSNTLYAFWIGGNDYMFDQTGDLETLTDGVVNSISSAIQRLIESHAKQFLVLSLPDMSKTPLSESPRFNQDYLHRLTITHNRKLAWAMHDLQRQHPEITLVYVDIGYFFDDLQRNPEKYNQKRHTTIRDTRHACWPGGYTLTDTTAREVLQDTTLPHNLASLIATSPDLSETWRVSRLAATHYTPCPQPDDYIFWDRMHPTAVAHRLVSLRVTEELEAAGVGSHTASEALFARSLL